MRDIPDNRALLASIAEFMRLIIRGHFVWHDVAKKSHLDKSPVPLYYTR
jgi:hypothetical protein